MSEDGSSSSSAASTNSLHLKRRGDNGNGERTEAAIENDTTEDATKRRRRFSAHNNQPETANIGGDAVADDACDNLNSLESINVVSSDGTTNSLTNSASTTVEEFDIQLDTPMSTSKDSALPQNTTEDTQASTSQAESSSTAVNETDPLATAAGVDSGNVVDIDGSSSLIVEAGDDSTNEFIAARYPNLRRRQYRRSGQRISSHSSESSENSLDGDGNAVDASQNNHVNRNVDNDSDSTIDSNVLVSNSDDASDDENYDDNIDMDSDSSSTDTPLLDDDGDDDSNIARRRFNSLGNMFGGRRNGAARADADAANNEAEVEAILSKPMPPCKWNTLDEVLHREYGFSNRFATAPKYQSHRFNARFYASTFVVERMKRSHCLRKHRGCVNSLNFNRSGDLLCSGSDDRRIIVWDWAHNKVKHSFTSGHRENIFQTKFVTSGAGIDIVSAGRDGQVRRSVISSSGKAVSQCLYKHRNAVHKLVICPNSQFELLSAGEDGNIRHCDLRDDPQKSTSLIRVTTKNSLNSVLLFGISHHPYAPEVVVCGSDEYVRVYDKRKFEEPVHLMCPSRFNNNSRPNACYVQATCCTYNHNGNEILASYSDEQIYLFDNKNYVEGSYLHTYCGHYNHRTIKGVNFFGPNSEYIISGSDCGNIFFWDKETEAILNCMPGDDSGVVNCLEPHPNTPVLATSGLDYNVKIWSPGSQITVPAREKLKKCISRNIKRSERKVRIQFLDRALNDFILQTIRSNASDDRAASDDTGASLDGFDFNPDNVSTSQSEESSPSVYRLGSIFDSDDDDSDEAAGNFEGLTCSTQ